MSEKPKMSKKKIEKSLRISNTSIVNSKSICNLDDLDGASSIQISITSIDNFDNILLKTLYPIIIYFKITFGKQMIGISDPIEINSRFAHSLDFTCQHIIGEAEEKVLDELCREPYVISVVCDKLGSNAPVVEGIKAAKLSKHSLKGRNSPYGSTSSTIPIHDAISSSRAADLTSGVIYQTTLDPLPILLGDDLNKETLVLKPLLGVASLIVDLRYPVISVTLKPKNTFSRPAVTNLLSISLESLVNFDVMKLAKFSKCTATVHFLNKDTMDESLKNLDSSVTFDSTEFVKPFKFQPPAKRWFTLANLPGDSRLSLYRNEGDMLDLKYPDMGGPTPLSYYEDIMTSSKLDIRWYQFRRMWLSPELQQNILDNIVRHKTWLVELTFEKHQNTAQKGKIDEDTALRYVAYVDVSNLLHPGVNSTRVISHLWSYNSSHIELMTGITVEPQELWITRSMNSIKEERRPTKNNAPSRQSSEITSNYGKPATRSSKKKISKALEEPPLAIIVSEMAQQDATEIINEDKKPVFLILQVELFKSLLPRKPPLDKKTILSQGAPDLKLEEYQKVTLQRKAWYSFKTNIQKIADMIQQEYRWFNKFTVDIPEISDDPDSDMAVTTARSYMITDPGSSVYVKTDFEKRDFYDWLIHSPEYGKIQDLVKITLVNYVKNFVNVPRMYKEDHLLEFQSSLYSKLVGDVHEVLNDFIQNIDSKSKEVCFTSSEELLFGAIEWSDKEDFDQAKSLLLKRIFFYGELDADLWIDLAVVCLHHNETSAAKDAICHALSMSPRSRDALVMYAALLHGEEQYSLAEIFFNSLTQFYPRFYQGWLILNIYYSVVENHQGRDITLAMASKCLADLPQPDTPISYRRGSHCWSSELVGEGDAYIETATYLLSLGLYEYVENCLSARLIRTGERSLPHYYYLAVAYHCQKKYIECECILDAAFSDFQDHGLYSIRGHNFYIMGKKEEAKAMFKCATQHPEAPEDNFLSLFRYAEDLYESTNEDEAEVIFTKLAFSFPSALSWCYLGKIQFDSSSFETSEKSFTVANRIDPTYSEPWAYLAMIAVINKKFELAEKCLSEAKKYGKINDDLAQKINCIFNAHSDQMLSPHRC